jgi:hypothetical protein
MWLTNQASFASLGLGSRDPAATPVYELLATPLTVCGFVLWVRIVRAVTEAQKRTRGDGLLTS